MAFSLYVLVQRPARYVASLAALAVVRSTDRGSDTAGDLYFFAKQLAQCSRASLPPVAVLQTAATCTTRTWASASIAAATAPCRWLRGSLSLFSLSLVSCGHVAACHGFSRRWSARHGRRRSWVRHAWRGPMLLRHAQRACRVCGHRTLGGELVGLIVWRACQLGRDHPARTRKSARDATLHSRGVRCSGGSGV